jgi:hypothetical protein
LDFGKPKVTHLRFRVRYRKKLGECNGRYLESSDHLTLQLRMQTTDGFLMFEVAEVSDIDTAWPLLHTVTQQRGVVVLEYRTTDHALGSWQTVPGAPEDA